VGTCHNTCCAAEHSAVMLHTQATLTTAISFLFNTCHDQKQSVKSYSYPVSHQDIQRVTGMASHVLAVTLDAHTHIGQWVGPTNGQGALNKKDIACPNWKSNPRSSWPHPITIPTTMTVVNVVMNFWVPQKSLSSKTLLQGASRILVSQLFCLLLIAKFQVFTAVLLKIRFLCDVRASGSQRSEGSYCLHIQGQALQEECDDTASHSSF